MIEEFKAYADHQFWLHEEQQGGGSRLDHLRQHEEQTRRRPEELDGPPCPPELEHVWRWFDELSGVRGTNGFGPNPITPTLVIDWMRCARVRMSGFEYRALRVLDSAFLLSIAKRQQSRNKTEGGQE